jgi:carbonic anhydrase
MTDNGDLLKNSESYATTFNRGALSRPPARKLAIVTCMDARIDTASLLGLREGDAHIIRNAGGVITDGEIRSLAISQRLMATEEVFLIHHTDCGMQTFSEDEFRTTLEEETGQAVPWPIEAFKDLDLDVRKSMERVRTSPFLPHRDKVRGFVYEVETGLLREVV